jgi:tetraacyldisaccharide 4'-kinase
MMAMNLKGVPVLVGQNRYQMGRLAIREFAPEVIVLDDAFQHMKLARDIDLVLLDHAHPLGNGHLLPRGILREPISALTRGSAYIFTRADAAPGERPDPMFRTMTGKPVFKASHTPRAWKAAAGGSGLGQDRAFVQDQALEKISVYAFSGIARNSHFRDTLKAMGCRLVGYSEFHDHHPYTPGELHQICRSGEAAGAAALVTTEKDYARIGTRFSWPLTLLVVGVRMTFEKDDKPFDAFLARTMSSLP